MTLSLNYIFEFNVNIIFKNRFFLSALFDNYFTSLVLHVSILWIIIFSVTNILDCTFEHRDTCDWINSAAYPMQWTLHKGLTLTQNTGPNTDHTTGGKGGRSLNFIIYFF